jgi:hypothetical protein
MTLRTGGEGLLVAGGGAAGMAAALAAAGAGAHVWLVEASAQLGGTVANALIHTLGGLYDGAGKLLHDGLPRQLLERLTAADRAVRQRRLGRAWVLNVCPDVYRHVTREWIAQEPRIHVLEQTRVVHIRMQGCRVIDVEVQGAGGRSRLPVSAVVDATGTAEVVRLVDASLVQQDPQRAAGGLIVRLRGVQPGTLAAPRGLAVVRALRKAAAEGSLPAACDKAWVDSGVRDDEAYVKLFVPWATAEGEAAARQTAAGVCAFLQHLAGFQQAVIDRVGCLGIRDGGRICGEYCLTGDDVRAGRHFDDAACRCAWPIEYWDPERGVCLEYLPEDCFYEVPLRALQLQGVRNLWAAGKCLSADRYAHASARVAGTCWAMGEAAGRAAAL